jgi:hypothetical protein
VPAADDLRGLRLGLLPELTREAAELARELRRRRRTRTGLKGVRATMRWRPWPEIADELARQGHGRHAPQDVADAVARLPLEGHELAPPPAAELAQLEEGWRAGWLEEFPGEPWPGRAEAQRRIRAKNFPPR